MIKFYRPRIDGPNGILPDKISLLAPKRPLVPVLMGITRDNWAWEMLPINFNAPDPFLTTYAGVTIDNATELVNATCDALITDQAFLERKPENLR